MSAPTKELEVDGHKIVIREYLTARQARPIEESSVAEGNTKPGGGLTSKGLLAVQDKSIEAVVVSLDGSEENILERLLDLPQLTYNKVREAVTSVIAGEDKKKA